MWIKIKSANKNLLSLLNKNPLTDDGLYLKPLRKGHIIGNCVSENEYEIFFHDTKHSYTNYEDNQIDFKSFCSPEIILNVTRDLFGHILKERERVLKSEISWLNSTFEETDNTKCIVEIDNIFIKSSWYRDNEFLLSRYIDEINVIENDNLNIYSLTVESDSVFDCINKLALTAFFIAITNDREFYIQNSQIEKFVDILRNVENVPYFVYYLYIKRCCTRSPKVFEKLAPRLTKQYEESSGNKASFTINDTHTDRMLFVRDNIDMESPVINFGCGEMRHERFMAKRFKSDMYSYDVEDYSELQEKFKQRYSFNWEYRKELKFPQDKQYQLICSEVIEHDDTAIYDLKVLTEEYDIKKIIITTPNKSFNTHYGLSEDQARLDDHEFELTYPEFKEYVKILGGKQTFFEIGDKINEDFVTCGCIIEY